MASADQDWNSFSEFMMTFWRGQLSSAVAATPKDMIARLSGLTAKSQEPLSDATWQRFMSLPSSQALALQRMYPCFSCICTDEVRGFVFVLSLKSAVQAASLLC